MGQRQGLLRFNLLSIGRGKDLFSGDPAHVAPNGGRGWSKIELKWTGIERVNIT